jgi:uncharacterized protein YjbI with pentapeptide repeats
LSGNYAGTNMSGIDMTGWAPGTGNAVMTLGATPGFGGFMGGPNLNGANLTGATNVDVNLVARAHNVSGLILTGTGITKAAFEASIVQSISALIPLGLAMTPEQIQATAEARSALVTF